MQRVQVGIACTGIIQEDEEYNDWNHPKKMSVSIQGHQLAKGTIVFIVKEEEDAVMESLKGWFESESKYCQEILPARESGKKPASGGAG